MLKLYLIKWKTKSTTPLQGKQKDVSLFTLFHVWLCIDYVHSVNN